MSINPITYDINRLISAPYSGVWLAHSSGWLDQAEEGAIGTAGFNEAQ